MDFLQYTTNWIKGEIFEATLFGSFGLLTIISSLILWKFGETPNSKALIIPLIVVGLLFLGTAITSINTNQKKLPQYTEAYKQEPSAFVKSEKARVEGFQYLYTVTIIIASVCFVLAICAFVFTHNPTVRAIGIALAILGITGLVIDYFSKERADHYYKEITTEMKSHYS
ncbi:hypothetical protein [Flavobacterium psychrotolerans]|uniref:Uncharacterized protein n=1 Tax=Flavobacterium psychrotolerans TaxID=2169410 RepID=A0A2U1JL53_9FLAO|nr:hypothetical protein [Flavobacterium psychrotolerans]PWA05872.1 hypothetical protein DB895_05475 [Flavobacterium psychrotolerans]